MGPEANFFCPRLDKQMSTITTQLSRMLTPRSSSGAPPDNLSNMCVLVDPCSFLVDTGLSLFAKFVFSIDTLI